MSKAPQLGELSRTVRFGLLSEEVAFSTGRMIAGEELSQEEQSALKLAAEILRSLPPGEERKKAPSLRIKYMASDESYLDAIELVRSIEPAESVRDYLDKIATALERASERDVDRDWLTKANEMFSLFGESA